MERPGEGLLGGDAAVGQAGQVPNPLPCEAYCHSLADPSILSDDLRAAAARA
ncbi:hypothetical protein MAHJHV54_49240 [Mycobacterium avium subsp. hominissuis]